ncbi:DUF4123 domain-containing protein [Halomonas sp. SH5A2]|uniref:DUF4123 domain-containing protein n=1 Tax=Halomonas sp. SH5A2 TaxID=2749040 RepID=UPI00164134E4|nr:DUF4123 domain-containing protein [Halomonas sp. SH5A2]QNI02746.1 DUF4123 domain-containing protein [Halomonas sp. SH5A2]
MERPQAITHALVDGIRYPNALQRLYSRNDVDEIEPLYLMTRWSSLAEQGPILVRLKSNGLAEEAYANDARLYRSLSLLSSPASTGDLSSHLVQFVTFKGEEGQEQLLRFGDPLVTRHWLGSYGNALPAALMGPIDTWWVADWAPDWAEPRPIIWQAFRSQVSSETTTTVSADAFPPMGRDQLTALEAVIRWQLKERLTDYFNEHAAEAWQTLPTGGHGQWLDDRLNDAIAWGANTERQMAIWVALSLFWGNDFMTANDGLYARWARHSPNKTRLSRQDQLNALDAWRCTPPINASQGIHSHESLS